MIILIKLLLAHLLGDFLFQPTSWVKAKEHKKIKSYQLYLHSIIHFLLILLLTSDFRFLKWALIIAIFHLLIDVLKLYLQNPRTKRNWFFIDQLFHLILILVVWYWSQNISFNFELFNNGNILLLITTIYFLTQPSSVIIRSIISKWTPTNTSNGADSLANAGKYIGILERLFVFAFVISGNWEAIGFLLASKSVFRFGDLKESKDRKLTEYVLIGTLLSFGTAMMIGYIFLKVQELLG
jgi:hypothetical protein